MKSVSILALLFVLFFVLFETPKIKAQVQECVREYDAGFGDFDDFTLCRIPGYPFSSLCSLTCQRTRDAKGGICKRDKTTDYQCFCDYCNPTTPYFTTKSLILD
ncbi:unnamed protein product [Microthlaspi erraticum]|uniref:Knottin scorpion toxin-like domain-containing protein n=1 Tax=Microthlaspi erraticum TaxID=1685480 RepID=A0A6D2JGL8_9BRAS|nr:unnamed protein product [Microthlaspi erraticum]